MPQPIMFIESFRIRPGKGGELHQAATTLSELIHSREPQLIAYKLYIDPAGTEGTIVHIHPDDASLEHHHAVLDGALLPVVRLIEIDTIQICGNLAERLVQDVRDRVRAFGSTAVVTRPLQAGFVRSHATF